MSSQQGVGVPAVLAGNAASVSNGNGSLAIAKDGNFSRSFPASTVEPKTMTKVSSEGDLPKSNSANDPLPSQQANDAQSDAASASSSGSQTDGGTTRSRTRKHFTRSKNSDAQQNGEGKPDVQQDSSPTAASSASDEANPFIDAFAATLARLDEDAYKRAVFRDANSLLENIVLPMSFPWAHRMAPVVRNIPRDIDEMPAIQGIDDPEHEVCAIRHSNFDLSHPELALERTGSFEAFQTLNAAARRAEDPGIIELVTSAPPPEATRRGLSADDPVSEEYRSVLLKDPLVERNLGPNIASLDETRDYDVNIPGELSYRVFEQIQETKRRKLEAGMARRKTLMISVKVASTSSRPSLFGQNQILSSHPMLLPAVLPQDNRPASSKSKSAARTKSGRSQLIWLEKNATSSSQRDFFISYLTNEKIEPGNHKRPREVSVGIRVNGKLLMSDITLDQALERENLSKRKRDGKLASLYDAKKVNEALDVACTPAEQKPGTRQCTMDTEEFVGSILSQEMDKERSMGWNSKINIKDLDVVYVAPRIDCLPTEDGLVRVLCTSPGELQPADVRSILDKSSRKKSPICTVCWREKSLNGEKVVECNGCRLIVHMSCCRGIENSYHTQWKCALCSQISPSSLNQSRKSDTTDGGTSVNEKSSQMLTREPSRAGSGNNKCIFCPHVGGTMSMLDQSKPSIWAHDVCRTWCDFMPDGATDNRRDKKRNRHLVCALCGISDAMGNNDKYCGLTKCAASGCSVYFHPMCALFLSKCEEYRIEHLESSKSVAAVIPSGTKSSEKTLSGQGKESQTAPQDSRLEKLREHDRNLCRQYTLIFAKGSVPGSGSEALQTTAVLPVCFCGIHNPKRDRSFYGLYPGGHYMDEHVMRVPPRRTKRSGGS